MSVLLKVEHQDGVAILTLNRPKESNALSKGLTDALCEAISAADANAMIAAIILTGAGNAFCAGVDLKELSKEPAILQDDSAFVAAFANCSKPIIAAVNGYAITGGLELALNCDFIYASESAKFGDTHAKVGLMPTWGMSQKLPRLIGINRAREMSLSGQFIDAQTALAWGLVNKVLLADDLLPAAIDTAQAITNNDTQAVSAIRALVNDGWAHTLDHGLSLENDRSRPYNAALDFKDMERRLSELRKK